MRLRGSIEAEISWREPELDCTGMSRPDGRGLRVRFAGPLASGGELAVVFAAPELGKGVSGRSVPVNVTLLDAAGERIYGTQGDSRCVLDEVAQRAIDDVSYPAGSYRVSASGFCVAPARAVDGDGSVLLTRFDFAGRVTFREEVDAAAPDQSPASLFPELERSGVDIVTATGTHRFAVWIAADHRSQARGLMDVRELPPAHGMLFLFEQLRPASFWMKDTYLPLDIIFVGDKGVVVNVAHNARPLSLDPIESAAPVMGVLELAGGTAQRISLEPGDKVIHTAFGNREPRVGVVSTQHPFVAKTRQNTIL
jgi:uncharacterized membrane protein (UPF0127 family)